MNNANHIQGGGSHIREVMDEIVNKPKDHRHEVKEALDFYLNSDDYTEVYIVRCDNCGNDMCLEVLEPATQQAFAETHHEGRRRITLGFEDAPDGYLLSHRKRLDGMMGYQCGAMVVNPKHAQQVREYEGFNKVQLDLNDGDTSVALHRTVTEPELIPCGNNTIISTHERGYTRKGAGGNDYLPSLEPHQMAKLQAQMVRTGRELDIVKHGNLTRLESFTVERLK